MKTDNTYELYFIYLDIASKLNSSNRNGSRMMYNHQKSDTFRQILALSTSFHNRTNFNRINYSITDRENQLNFPVRNDRKNITITCTQLSRGLKGIFKDEEWILNRTNLFPPIGPPPYGFPPPFGLSNRFHNRIAPHLSVFGLSNIPHGEEQGIGMSTPGWPHFPPAFSRGRFPPPFIRQKIVDIFLIATNNMTTDPWRDGLIPIPLPLQLGNSENHIPSGHLPPPTAVDELFRMFSNIPLVIEGTTQDHISSGQYCDGVIDCSSREDEMSCPGRFYCESGNTIYVDRTAVMDGVADCADESDEWPEDYAESTMASKDSMIKDWPLRLLMWTIGIVSVLGNSMVIITNLRNFITVSKNGKLKRATTRFMSSISCKEKQQETLNSRRKSMGRTHTGASIKISERQRIIKLWNRGLVLNLALADFLMGVYLLSLASVSISKQEGYWAFDKIWRTSISCQLLGMIVMISSQTSMYTLVALTTLRLYTVVRPFSVAYLQKKNLWIFCIIAWMTSIFLAVLPSAPHVKYYFASVAWVPFPHFRPPVLDLVHADEFVRTLADLTGIPLAESLQESQMSWWNVVDYVDQVSPAYYSNWKFFGFYSAHSVCIPKLYVTTDDVGWWYTVAFLCLIFIAVLYMGIAYSIIYFHSTSILRASTSNSNVTDKEKGTKAISVCDSCETSLHASHNPDRNTIQYPRLKLLLDYITCRKARNNADDKTKAKTITDDSRSSGSPSRITKSAYNTSEMQCRIALLIVTDCLCWIPICIMGFCKLAGYNIPGRAYSISAIGLLPVNSALNPLLYSRTIQEFWNKYYGLFKKYIFMCSTKNGV